MDETRRIQELIEELAELAPWDGVAMRFDTGHDDGENEVLDVHATPAAYLRVGVMFLRAAYAPAAGAPSADGDELYVEVPVMDDEAALPFRHFRRWAEVPLSRGPEEASSWVGQIAGIVFVGVIGIVLVLAYRGFLQVLKGL